MSVWPVTLKVKEEDTPNATMYEFTINGNKFRSKVSFLNHVGKVFVSDHGKNLDAFVDLLEGGFEKHAAGERIKVTWINIKKSRERLPSDLYKSLLEILEGTENVVFERHEFGIK